jgi:hypothetical protein
MIDKNDTQKKYEEWYKENAERVFGQSEIWKRIQRGKKLDKAEREEKTEEIEYKENHDPFRKLDLMAREWIKRYLSLTGIMRNQYGQIVDRCKRLSAMQISHILKEVHNYDVSPEMVGKFKQFLIKEGVLKTDEEFEESRPSEEELRQIRKEGARAFCIKRSREKDHLDKEELNQILEKKKDSEDVHSKMRKLKEDIEVHGYCPTDSEETELEECEESQDEED